MPNTGGSGSGGGGASSKRNNVDDYRGSSLAAPLYLNEQALRRIPGTEHTVGTPYDCQYRHRSYLDKHRVYASRGWNVNASGDPARLMSVIGQDSDSTGYYDRHGLLVQQRHVTSTSKPYHAERGARMPDRIRGLDQRVDHPTSSCRWDPRGGVGGGGDR